MKRRTWARGTYVDYKYSLDGLLIEQDYSDATPDVRYTRNRLGQVTSIKDGVGVLKYDYSDLGQREAERYTVGLLENYTLHRGYNAFALPEQLQLKRGVNTQHQIDYSYESTTGRLSSVSPASDWAVTYAYHPATGMPSGYTHQSSSTAILTQNKTYDAAGRLENISHLSGNNTVLNSYTYQLDGFGQRRKATLHNGSHWDYGYDSRGQLISAIKKTQSGTTELGSAFESSYDGLGNPINQKKGGGHSSSNLRNYAFTVNHLNQITNRSVPALLEVLGETPATSVTVNGEASTRQGTRYGIELAVDNSSSAQQIDVEVQATLAGDTVTKSAKKTLPAANQSYQYDTDGNLLSNGLWSYTWDAENRLIEAEYLLSSQDSERRKFLYLYDHQSRRILKREMRWNTTKAAWYAERQTKYIYDGWNCIAEILNEATLSKKYTWGLDIRGSMQGAGGVGGLLATEDILNGYQAAFSYDGNGNVTALVDRTNGNLLAEYEYTSFGRTHRAKGPQAANNTYRFSTKPQEKETKLYYYGYRYYDPEIGRWLNRDPIEEEGGVNLYGFVGNDGVGSVDVLGMRRGGAPKPGEWKHFRNAIAADQSTFCEEFVAIVESGVILSQAGSFIPPQNLNNMKKAGLPTPNGGFSTTFNDIDSRPNNGGADDLGLNPSLGPNEHYTFVHFSGITLALDNNHFGLGKKAVKNQFIEDLRQLDKARAVEQHLIPERCAEVIIDVIAYEYWSGLEKTVQNVPIRINLRCKSFKINELNCN